MTFSLMTLCIFSCKQTANDVTIAMENNSDIKPCIKIATYVNGNFYDTTNVCRSKGTVSYKKIIVKNLLHFKNPILKFFILNDIDTSICNIITDSIKNGVTVHINYNEILFKRGDSYYGRILEKDTVVKKEFYSEVMYN
jgi:hypothetical protein